MKDLNTMLKASWDFCIRNRNSLKIPLLCDMLTDENTADKQGKILYPSFFYKCVYLYVSYQQF